MGVKIKEVDIHILDTQYIKKILKLYDRDYKNSFSQLVR